MENQVEAQTFEAPLRPTAIPVNSMCLRIYFIICFVNLQDLQKQANTPMIKLVHVRENFLTSWILGLRRYYMCTTFYI
jgi:hypothetical protein